MGPLSRLGGGSFRLVLCLIWDLLVFFLSSIHHWLCCYLPSKLRLKRAYCSRIFTGNKMVLAKLTVGSSALAERVDDMNIN